MVEKPNLDDLPRLCETVKCGNRNAYRTLWENGSCCDWFLVPTTKHNTRNQRSLRRCGCCCAPCHLSLCLARRCCVLLSTKDKRRRTPSVAWRAQVGRKGARRDSTATPHTTIATHRCDAREQQEARERARSILCGRGRGGGATSQRVRTPSAPRRFSQSRREPITQNHGIQPPSPPPASYLDFACITLQLEAYKQEGEYKRPNQERGDHTTAPALSSPRPPPPPPKRNIFFNYMHRPQNSAT